MSWRDRPVSTLPEWFRAAIDSPREQGSVEVDGCDVAFQLWPGPAGARPLLLVHGFNAHSHWWDFIAPQLAGRWRVAAPDLTGMGDSDYRHEYARDTWADELAAVCDAAGFGDDAVLVAHSFGGHVAVHAANRQRGRFGGLVLLDSGLRDPDAPPSDRPTMGGRADPVYPDRQSAIQRFRLQPPQPCANQFVLDYIARESLMPVEGGGWGWKFDVDLFDAVAGEGSTADDYRSLELPVALLYGALSPQYSDANVAYMRSLLGEVPVAALADAHHHLFLDQPQAFVPALEGLLEALGLTP